VCRNEKDVAILRTGKSDASDKSRRHDREEPGRLRVAAHNLGEPMAVRPRVWCCS
jgi:hypothetical protein